VTLEVLGRRIESADRLLGLWLLMPADELMSKLREPMPMGLVLAMTDHDWQIAYMSADAHVVGIDHSAMRGFPLLGLIHPSVAMDFMVGAERAASGNVTVTLHTRVRRTAGGWINCRCCLVRMCDHHPPRLGVVIRAESAREAGEEILEAEVRRSAIDARATRALHALPALADVARGHELSARQTEVVSRLIAGESVSEIAESMFLSASTVRNHLAAIYRKLGVHSQAELLAALLRAQTISEDRR
jgi:DNA-binding CsgD family transcriptional regulator